MIPYFASLLFAAGVIFPLLYLHRRITQSHRLWKYKGIFSISLCLAALFPVLISTLSLPLSLVLLLLSALMIGFVSPLLRLNSMPIPSVIDGKKTMVYDMLIRKEPVFREKASPAHAHKTDKEAKLIIPENFKRHDTHASDEASRFNDEKRILKNKYFTPHATHVFLSDELHRNNKNTFMAEKLPQAPHPEHENNVIALNADHCAVPAVEDTKPLADSASVAVEAETPLIPPKALSYMLAEIILMDGMIAQEEDRHDDAERSFTQVCLQAADADQVAIAYYHLKAIYAEYGLHKKIAELGRKTLASPLRDLSQYQKIIEDDIVFFGQ
ncbi:hypothetical protein [Thiorhodospira sibirica]|uniref:hypothetical protein n=1 Tax=Thiorhodospira sibirica TaxID=154347 RepID=UPI00022C056B|nr:hypothetical protein [Thiorhodospira sibirica]